MNIWTHSLVSRWSRVLRLVILENEKKKAIVQQLYDPKTKTSLCFSLKIPMRNLIHKGAEWFCGCTIIIIIIVVEVDLIISAISLVTVSCVNGVKREPLLSFLY